MDQASSMTTCMSHVALAAVTGWSVKHLPGHDVTGVGLMNVLLWCLMLYSLLGILRFSHPDPGSLLRMLYDRTALIAKVCPLPFLTAQLYLQPDPSSVSWGSGPFPYSYQSWFGHLFFLSGLFACATCFLFRQLQHRHISDCVTTVVVLFNAAGLAIIACFTHNLWVVGQIVSFVSKHFLLPRLIERYALPHALLYTYGLIFFEIFAVNAIIESISSVPMFV